MAIQYRRAVCSCMKIGSNEMGISCDIRYHPNICLQGIGNTTKAQLPAKDSKWEYPRYVV